MSCLVGRAVGVVGDATGPLDRDNCGLWAEDLLVAAMAPAALIALALWLAAVLVGGDLRFVPDRA